MVMIREREYEEGSVVWFRVSEVRFQVSGVRATCYCGIGTCGLRCGTYRFALAQNRQIFTEIIRLNTLLSPV